MAVHAIEIVTDPDSVPFSEVEAAVQNWKNNHESVLTTMDSDLSHVQMEDLPEFFSGRWRFKLGEDKDKLISELEKVLRDNFSWWRIKYHLCYADEENPEKCSSDYTNSGGNVPESV